MITERPRILVVDDEANARSALGELLGDAGFEVSVAASAREGLALLDSFHPDVLITDVDMPVMSGVELERISRGRCPRVVFMSSHPRYPGVGGPWLPKPIDVAALLAALDDLLRGRRQ